MKKSVSQRYHFVRWADGTTITKFPFDNIVENHGAPYYLVHRADLHAGLLEAAEKSGVTIHKNQRVVEYNFEVPSCKTVDGKTWTADLIIGADGMIFLVACLTSSNTSRNQVNRATTSHWPARCSPRYW
jgi:salicylate hydroxylase